MKKILLLLYISVIVFFPQEGYAKFAIVDIDPQCHINGRTCKTTGCQVSDTSRWSVPVAYKGECQSVPQLSASSQDKIFEIADNFFRNNEMYRTDREYLVLNSHGQEFVSKKLFPAIQVQIRGEMQKENPNYKIISIYQYLASVIGYDYGIWQPKY